MRYLSLSSFLFFLSLFPLDTLAQSGESYCSDPSILKIHLYMSPQGSDSNTGYSSSQAFKTINKVKQKIDELTSYYTQADPQQYDKECGIKYHVHVAAGYYYGQSISWQVDNRIAVRIEGPDPNVSKANFDGKSIDHHNVSGKNFMSINGNGRAPITIKGLVVKNYQNGIQLYTQGSNPTWQDQLHGILIWKNFFTGIGNGKEPSYMSDWCPGFGALQINKARDNTVVSNTFYNNINAAWTSARGNNCVGSSTSNPDNDKKLIHHIYLSGSASYNDIHSNTFKYATGAYVKLRNFSNFNQIENNWFKENFTGMVAVQDYYKHNSSSGDTSLSECANYINVLDGNQYDSSFNGINTVETKTWKYNALCENWLPSWYTGEIYRTELDDGTRIYP